MITTSQHDFTTLILTLNPTPTVSPNPNPNLNPNPNHNPSHNSDPLTLILNTNLKP